MIATHFIRHFPCIRQHDAMDCGPVCLAMVCANYGVDMSVDKLREACHLTRDGVSLLGIADAAEGIGFHTVGVRLTWKQLCDEVSFPCIVHWNQNHFVVVYGVRRRGGESFICVADPAEGLLDYPMEVFLTSWLSISGHNGQLEQGIALLLEPTSDLHIHTNDKARSRPNGMRTGLMRLFAYVRPHRRKMAFILLSMAVGSILSMLLPYVTQTLVDRGVSSGNLGLVKMMLLAQLCIVLGQLGADMIRGTLMLHVTARVSVSVASAFLAKLMRLPLSFFDSRRTGDILQRIQDNERIRDFLTESVLGMVMSAAVFVVYGIVLCGYGMNLFGVFLLGSVLYVVWVLILLRKRRKLDFMRFQAAAANQGTLVQLVEGMQEIRLIGCEKTKRWDWERIQGRLFRIGIKGLSLLQLQQAVGVFLDQGKNALISFLAARAVIEGDMTLGMMTALTYVLGQLNAPVSQFVAFVRSWQDARIAMERLEEVSNRPDEESAEANYLREIPSNGDLTLQGVTFHYEGPHSPKALDEVTLHIPHGKVTAVVGASGSGKTTLLKLLLGFYFPTQGKILLAGRKLGEYSPSAWHAACGCVMQEGFIFSDSIAGNIAPGEETLDMVRIRRAARIANLSEWVESLPMGYHTRIGSDGVSVSGGQRQRILIARAAYRNAPFLFLDEATNALDACNERTIIERLGRLFQGKTVLVIAHRLSTVKDADNIVVLDGGKLVEQGTHADLVARRGHYWSLVRNQLDLGN